MMKSILSAGRSLTSKEARSSITCIKVFDLTRNGAEDVIVSREDGRIEVYTQELGDLEAAGLHLHKPRLAFSHDVGEKVQALECGNVNSTVHYEIVAATYSGKVISFTTERISDNNTNSSMDRLASFGAATASFQSENSNSSTSKSTAEVNNENRIKHIHKEIEGMRDAIEKTKSKIKKLEFDSPLTGLPFSSPSARTSNKSIVQSSDFSSSAKFARIAKRRYTSSLWRSNRRWKWSLCVHLSNLSWSSTTLTRPL